MEFVYYWIELDGEGKHMVVTANEDDADKALHSGKQIFIVPVRGESYHPEC